MKKNVHLPYDAQYDYIDIFGGRHYHTDKRSYVVDKNGYTVSYSPKEYEKMFNSEYGGEK